MTIEEAHYIKSEQIKPSPKTIVITPKMVREQIVKIEELEMRLQLEIPRAGDMLKKNQLIHVLEESQEKKRQLYFMLYDMKKRGEIEQERQRKMKEDWDKNKCPKCEQAKLNDDGICPNCGFRFPCKTCGANHAVNKDEVDCSVDACPEGWDKDNPNYNPPRLDTPFTQADFEVGKQILEKSKLTVKKNE